MADPMFRLGLAVGRALIRTGLRIARAPRRRALVRWAESEGLALDGRARAHGMLANGSPIDAWLDDDCNAATLETRANAVLPSVAIRSRHAAVRSQSTSFELRTIQDSLSTPAAERRSAGGLFEARAERVAEDRLGELFALLERAPSPPTTVLAHAQAVMIEVYPPTSPAGWSEHAELLREVVARLSPRQRGPYG